MALRPAHLLLAAIAFLAAAPPALAQDAACGAPLVVTDAEGDQAIYPAVPAPEAVRHPEMDVLATTLAVDGADVVLTATLGAAPTADGPFSYRYWFGFHVKPAGGAAEYMDVRMHGKDALAGAPLITSNEQGNERIADLAPGWDGATATFRFPLALLHEVYGTADLQVGQPEASTDGPFGQEALMWFPTGVVYQVDHAPDGAGEWAPYGPCPEASEPAPAAPVAGEHAAADPATLPPAAEPAPQDAVGHDVPAWGLLGTLAALGAAAATRRR